MVVPTLAPAESPGQAPVAQQAPQKRQQGPGFSVAIVSPTADDDIVGRLVVRAEVAADQAVAVSAVDFFIDGRLMFSDAVAPYELLWNPASSAQHLIEVLAYGPGRQMVSARLETQGGQFSQSSRRGYSARVDRVELHVRIDDANREPQALDLSSFRVLEDGIEQPVISVEPVAELPLAVGLLIDHSESMLPQLETALGAAESFVEDMLVHPNDKAFVMGFADIPTVFQEFTNDSERLGEAISLIEGGDDTALYDSIVVAARRFVGTDGRRAAILLTDGADFGSDHTLREAIAAAQRADIALYPVGIGVPTRDLRSSWVLRELAGKTGGKYFSLHRRGDPSKIYAAIEEDLRAQYRVSYAPLIPGGRGEWRELEIQIRNAEGKNPRVRSRPGYFAR